MMIKPRYYWISILILITPYIAFAINDNHMIAFTTKSETNGITSYSLSLKLLFIMTLISMLPALLMTLTSFTRVLIVLAIVRQAIGLPNIPTNQILIGLSLLLTFFIMNPIFNEINDTAIQPYLQHQIDEESMISNTMIPLKKFMLNQTRESDLNLFNKIAGHEDSISDLKTVSLSVLMTAFITSELKTAFQIGFLIFIPFLLIDLVIASVLMSMGMMMLSPLVISLPFKIMLFVMVDGWLLIISSLSSSFTL
jgi:flagellar biosynthesis protein FliP